MLIDSEEVPIARHCMQFVLERLIGSLFLLIGIAQDF